MIEFDVNDIIKFRSQIWQIRSHNGLDLQLKCLDDGNVCTLPAAVIISDETFVGPQDNRPSIADQRRLDAASPQRRREAEFWYEHMYEVKYGVTPRDAGVIEPTAPTTPVHQRLEAKRQELERLGKRVSKSTLWRKWIGFNEHGIVGCLDQRGMPGHVRLSKIDRRVIATLEVVKLRFVEKSTPTKKQLIEIAVQKLVEDGVAPPCRSTMYELLKTLDRGEHTTGDATSRRSHANSPDRPYNKIVALFPGEEVQLDSTPLDAMVLMPDGTTCRVDLAVGIDVSTRSIPAAILRVKACKSVDAIELWANSCVPRQMLPGWKENMAIARSYVPGMISEAELDSYLKSMPIIDVRGLVVDNANIFVDDPFRRAAEVRGIHSREAPPYTPTAKPHIERLIKTIGDDFVRWVRGYKGRSVNHRGRHPERDAVWPLPILQALLDEWIITVYQNRPHAGLKLPMAPRIALSPNELYRALSQVAPTPVRSMTRDEWISLHPVKYVRINRYGINLDNLVYHDTSDRFHELKRTKSPNTTKKGRWEVRYDPNNAMQIWLRDESFTYDEQGHQIVKDNGWIECRWTLADQVTVPFGVDVVKAIARDLGRKKVSDKRILERAEAIHQRLLAGPPETKQRPLSRAEAQAGRANLVRQELCTPPPVEATFQGPSMRASETPVIPMEHIDFTKGW